MDRNTPIQRISQPTLEVVVQAMRKFAHQGKSDIEVRNQVEKICAQVEPNDYASEVLAIYYWVCNHIRYMRDIRDVEFVKQPSMVLATKTGDCDDIATLLAAMLMSCGNKCAFVLAAFTNPPIPSHVYTQVYTPAGVVALDPVANIETGRMFKKMTKSVVVPLE